MPKEYLNSENLCTKYPGTKLVYHNFVSLIHVNEKLAF